MADCEKELNRLKKVAGWYSSRGFYSRLVHYCYLSFRTYFRGTSCLEVGCSDGIMTSSLASDFSKVVALDGSTKFCEITRDTVKAKNLEVVCSLFEEYRTGNRFDTIIMAHVLEHVKNPVAVIEKARELLTDNGVFLINVPNADSIHRQAGVKMGLISRTNELNDLDEKLGHRRVYAPDTLKTDIWKAGFKILQTGGIFLKPITNSQIERGWTEEMMDAFYELGKEYPEIAAEIYAVCVK